MQLMRCAIDNENDDFDDIWAKVRAADLAILAAPIYWYGPPGAMKNFIDRTHGAFALPTPVRGLKVALLSVAGDDGCWDPHERIMASWTGYYGAERLPDIRILARNCDDAMTSQDALRRLDAWTEQLMHAVD